MRAFDYCRCPAVAVFAVGLLAFGVGAYGQSFDLVPVGATSGDGGTIVDYVGAGITCTDEPTHIVVEAGYEYVVEFEIRIAGWANAAGSPTLGTYQFAIDSTQYGFDGGGSLIPYDVPPPAGHNQLEGCYQGVKKCHEFSGGGFVECADFCDVWGPGDPACPGVIDPACGFCQDNPNFVFVGILATKAVSTADPNFAYGGTTNAGQCKTDESCPSYYGGTLKLVAPAAAKGTATFGFDPASSSTFMNNCGGSPIGGLMLGSGGVIAEVGACCTEGGDVCTSFVARPDCAGEFELGAVCVADGGTHECCQCNSDADCNDNNACTDDWCEGPGTLCICHNDLNFDPMVDCCNPGPAPNGHGTPAGGTETIDDGDICTVDTCDEPTGEVSNTPTAGIPCNDGNDCTHTDECDGVNPYDNDPSGCVGTPIAGIPCPIGDECPSPGTCEEGVCECSLSTPLCIEFDDPDGCYDCEEGREVINATVSIGTGSAMITGAQFLLEYDPTCIDFLSIDVCPGSPFQNKIASTVDEVAGQIFFAVTVDPLDPSAGMTPGPEDLACLQFDMLCECGPCNICFISVNPKNTILTNIDGEEVPLDICAGTDCSDDLWLDAEVELTVPAGAEVNSECDLETAIVTWDLVSATHPCEDPDIVCDAEHDGGVAITHLIEGGGEFPQGTSYFVCTASVDQCDNEVTKVWTVDVSDQQALDVYVQLSPVMNPGLFSRCITFELYDGACVEPTIYEQVLWFDGPYNFDGKARLEMKVPKGQYYCIAAQDRLHTLRACGGDIICEDGVYYAEFRGDPLLGGNWLIGGNLDAYRMDAGKDHIDIVDFGLFMSAIAAGATPDANTTCATAGPHADINADGLVNSLDYAFILDNYLAESKHCCCPTAAGYAAPLESISVKQARRQGLNLSAADLNRDGVIDSADMTAYQQGVRPASVDRVQKDTKALGR